MQKLRLVAYIIILTIISLWMTNTKDNKINFIAAVNLKYNLDIKPEQVVNLKPYDILKEIYGDQFDTIFNKAFNYKNRTEFTFRKNKFKETFPVIYTSTKNFREEDLCGFQEFICGISYCVIDNNMTEEEQIETLKHELSHCAQRNHIVRRIIVFSKQELKDAEIDEYTEYLLGSYEFSVRVSQLKRDYFKKTGVIIDSQTKARIAVQDLIKHHQKYNKDSQSLFELIKTIKTFKLENGSKRITEKIIEYLPQVVSLTDKQNTICA